MNIEGKFSIFIGQQKDLWTTRNGTKHSFLAPFQSISSTKADVGILFVLKESEKIKRQICLSKANLSLDLFTFLQNDNWVFSSTSTFHLYSFVFLRCRRGDLLNLSQFYRVSFCWHEGLDQWANGRWLTDHSKRASLLLFYNLKFEIVVEQNSNTCLGAWNGAKKECFVPFLVVQRSFCWPMKIENFSSIFTS